MSPTFKSFLYRKFPTRGTEEGLQDDRLDFGEDPYEKAARLKSKEQARCYVLDRKLSLDECDCYTRTPAFREKLRHLLTLLRHE